VEEEPGLNALAVRLALLISVVALVAIPAQASAAPDTPAAAAAKGKGKGKGKKKPKSLTVCKHGCKYRSIQDAVDKAKKKKVKKIKVEPGKYVEGVLIDGHKYDGLTITGTHKNAKKVILEGKNAKGEGGPAQNGIEATNVDDLTLKNMWARNYAANGFLVRDSDPDVGSTIDCNDYLMKNLYASFNRSYGMYAFQCAGGRITKSVGWGHGDSAFYIGGTPIQDDPKTTSLDKLEAFENVLGYSGTNSHYVDIHHSAFYNNGVGLVPNTLDSEPFEPSADGVIRENDIFWNNFNYFLPNSRVKTVSGGLGEIGGATINYPTGVGVALFGAQGWVVRDNNIFGNFKWGSAAFSDPFNEGDDAVSRDNQFLDNLNGRGGTDTNAVDFWIDGSGSGNCFSGNVSSTFDPSSGATNEQLYPTCPAPAPPASGTGTSGGDPEQQLGDLLGYVTTDPPENQECSWTKHPHPDYKDYEPLEVTPGPDCP
jgi:hypothetical protein